MARRVSRNQNDKEFLKHFYYQKKQHKKLLRKKERQYKGRTLQLLLDIENNNPNEFRKIIENLENNDKPISEKSEVISPDDWETHFKKLLISNSDSNDVPDVINSRQLDVDSYSDCLNRHITLTEIQKSLRQLKNKTSVGFDRISNEMLKQLSPQLLECINKLFNIIFTQRQ